MRIGIRLAVLILCLRSLASAQTRPSGAASIPTAAPIDAATLQKMYERELGPLYKSADAEAYQKVNELVEHYFANPGERKRIIAAIETLGLDPNIVGRITRIRMSWPALTGGVYYINEKIGPHDAVYFLGIPKSYDRTKAWPLVIKLPAADAFVNTPPPGADKVKSIYTAWISEELSRHPDAVVIMPLLHLDELWGPSYPGMYSVIAPMWHAADLANIDPARVYLVGHSMSAHAAWNLALHFTTHFAAFTALAGGCSAEWQRLRLHNLRNVLPVVWHDRADKGIKVDSSRRPVQVLRTLKIPVEYEETDGVGHVPDAGIVQRTYERMRGRARELYPKWITFQSNRPDSMFNRLDWLQVYQALRPGDEKRLYFRHGSGFMKTYPNLWKVDAKLENNRITATTDNVQLLRFYFNDQMIDFTKPVTVVVNKRGRFEAMLKPSIDEMLKDQLFLGRGWRYFTAVVDVDLAPPEKSATSPTTRP